MHAKQALAVFGGAVVAQLVVAALPLVVAIAVLTKHGQPVVSWPALLLFAVPVVADILLTTLLLLLPAFWWLAKRGWLTLWPALGVGVVEGLVVSALIFAFAHDMSAFFGVISVTTVLEVLTLSGALGGWAAWRWTQREK